MTSSTGTHTAPIMGISRHRLSSDGRGVTTLVGLHGCPLHCHYCLNDKCHEPAGIRYMMSAQKLYDTVYCDNIYFCATGGGITFGGGEPALHSDFIEEFARLNKQGWNITLETSLNVPAHHIAQLLPVVDDYIIDIKSLNPTIYRTYTGVSIEPLLSNLTHLIEQGKAPHITVRTPLIPGYNTTQDVEESTAKLRALGITRIDNFTYHTHPTQRTKPDGKQGKSTCNVLKKIRTIIADANHIAYTPTPCTHTSCTTGNCPMCEQELAWLTNRIATLQNPIL